MTDELETSIVTLSHDTPTDAIGDMVNRLDFMQQRVKELRGLFEAKLLERLIETNETLTIGTVKYYAGVKKTTRCIDVPGAVQALLEITGGDFDKTCEAFASQPLKHGHCKSVMGERWEEFFEVTEEAELKEGKPAKQLQKVDTRFLR